jgi:hypothetical protein
VRGTCTEIRFTNLLVRYSKCNPKSKEVKADDKSVEFVFLFVFVFGLFSSAYARANSLLRKDRKNEVGLDC